MPDSPLGPGDIAVNERGNFCPQAADLALPYWKSGGKMWDISSMKIFILILWYEIVIIYCISLLCLRHCAKGFSYI